MAVAVEPHHRSAMPWNLRGVTCQVHRPPSKWLEALRLQYPCECYGKGPDWQDSEANEGEGRGTPSVGFVSDQQRHRHHDNLRDDDAGSQQAASLLVDLARAFSPSSASMAALAK
jgi:hypothetical protein